MISVDLLTYAGIIAVIKWIRVEKWRGLFAHVSTRRREYGARAVSLWGSRRDASMYGWNDFLDRTFFYYLYYVIFFSFIAECDRM